jgi:hypothetical protein
VKVSFVQSRLCAGTTLHVKDGSRWSLRDGSHEGVHMAFSRSLSACCLIALASAWLGACSSDEKADDLDEVAGMGGSSSQGAGSGGSAGNAFGNAGTVTTPSAGTGGTTASSAGAGSGGVTAGMGASAGTGGSGGTGGSSAGSMAAGSSSAGTSAQPDAGVPAEEDPFAGLFGPDEVSCEGLLCLDTADCASLYPEENAQCKFTGCVDFMCM